ncbi:MAG: hypothetical protein PHO33_03065 [Clostridia bacterium]|jgi:hypothetical protein|nr:hypothetical protein [Clostridia bacterium]MDD4275939.1 hypothetical protein [Clostridia bacterium]
MKYEAYIKSATAIVKLIVEKDIFSAIVNDEFFYSYIPSVSLLNDEEVDNNVDAVITIETNNTNKINIKYPHIYFSCNQINTKDIISLIEYVFERARQGNGIICIHGAGAIIDNKLIACWGPATGMGKTTLALKLSEKENYFYSDEKLLIDLRNSKAVGRIKNQYISNQYWKNKLGEKQYFEPANLSEDIPYEIGLFVQAIICDQVDYTIDIWKPEKFLWHLYEESSRKIRGTSRIFFDNTYPVMSLDTDKIAIQRLKLIKDFTKNITTVYFKGQAEKAVNIVAKMLANKDHL